MHSSVVTTMPSANVASWGARCAAATAIVVGFWFVGHSLTHSRTLLAESAISADRIENHFAEQQSETTTSSAVGYLVLGGLGLWCASQAQWRQLDWRHLLILFCAVYVGWCAVSMMWSIEPAQTFRKLAILGLMLAGAYGANRLIPNESGPQPGKAVLWWP